MLATARYDAFAPGTREITGRAILTERMHSCWRDGMTRQWYPAWRVGLRHNAAPARFCFGGAETP